MKHTAKTIFITVIIVLVHVFTSANAKVLPRTAEIVPAETVKDIKTVSIPQYSTLDPLPWLRRLEEDFVKAEGVADVILGVASKEMTEASGKILYLAWENVVKANQRFLTEQINKK